MFGFVHKLTPLRIIINQNGYEEFAKQVLAAALGSQEYTVAEIQLLGDEFELEGWTKNTWHKSFHKTSFLDDTK